MLVRVRTKRSQFLDIMNEEETVCIQGDHTVGYRVTVVNSCQDKATFQCFKLCWVTIELSNFSEVKQACPRGGSYTLGMKDSNVESKMNPLTYKQ